MQDQSTYDAHFYHWVGLVGSPFSLPFPIRLVKQGFPGKFDVFDGGSFFQNLQISRTNAALL